MFDDILTKTYYNNTIGDWMIALALIGVSIILARIAYSIIGKYFKKYTARTESKLDDILVDMLEEPLVFALIIIGIWYSLQTLHLSTAIEDVIGKAYYILIVFDVAWFIVRLIDVMIEQYLVPFVRGTETKLDDQLLPIIRKGMKASIWILAILVALNNAGYNVGAILASLGIGGLAFALAAKDTVANLFGSLTIFLDEPFEIGDRIIINGYDGVVEEVGLRSTRLRLLNGRIITMSNSSMTNSPTENISSEPSRQITLDLGLTYDTDEEKMQQAMDILQDVITKNNLVENKVTTAFMSFGDFSLNIRLIYYIKKGSCFYESQSRVNMEILKRFNQEKLEFAFPTQTIFTYKEE